MITTDPYGDIMFSDGVFHRSQLETPFGVVRGADATTHCLNPITGRINTEWQTQPESMGITFDKWGYLFKYTEMDRFMMQFIDLDTTSISSLRYVHICSCGKGSAVASVSSPNFPDRFKRCDRFFFYAVNLTAISYKDGKESWGP